MLRHKYCLYVTKSFLFFNYQEVISGTVTVPLLITAFTISVAVVNVDGSPPLVYILQFASTNPGRYSRHGIR